MQKTIFRREIDSSDQPEEGSLKNLVIRKRRNTKPLISFFSNTEKLKLVKSIFNRDNKKFLLFMEELDTMPNWREAYSLMETEFYKRDINIFSPKARFLTDRVYNVFFPDDISL